MQLPLDDNPLKEGFIFVVCEHSDNFEESVVRRSIGVSGIVSTGYFAKLNKYSWCGYHSVTYEEYYFHPIGRI